MNDKKPSRISRGTGLRLAVSAGLLALTALVYLLAKYQSVPFLSWYQPFSRKLLWIWAHITDLVPFHIMEWGFVGLAWLALGWLIRVIAYRKGLVKLITTALLIFSIILSSFVCLWGADQFAPTFIEKSGYNETSYTIEEAAEAAVFYLYMANAYAEAVPRDEEGISDFGSFRDVAAELDSGYRYLEETYGEAFAVGKVTPKPMAFSWLMSSLGLTGIYTAYTGEIGINVDTPDQSIPYVISHECAHRTTVTQENDANFVAFLACTHSDSILYQYSGYYSAFIYVYNAISKVNQSVQSTLWGAMSEKLKADVVSANAHYAAFEKPVKQVAQRMNDSYLKTFNQPTGINNYGAVAGALIAYYWKDIKIQ